MIYTTPKVLFGLEISEILKTCKDLSSLHHEDEGHHIGSDKPYFLGWVAARFQPHLKFGTVDPKMKLFILHEKLGKVPEHKDADYTVAGKVATHSMLIYLNDDYKGGETYFGSKPAPKPPVGGALIFEHSKKHSGAEVLKGKKLVLKTDILQ